MAISYQSFLRASPGVLFERFTSYDDKATSLGIKKQKGWARGYVFLMLLGSPCTDRAEPVLSSAKCALVQGSLEENANDSNYPQSRA